MIRKRYDLVFSIGEACLCAGILGKLELRNFSSPFDWISGAVLEERVQILLSNFADFINREDLEKIGQRDMPEPRDIYLNHRNQITFNHDFPLNGNLEKDYPKIRAKYEHRIKKLLSTISTSKSVLMVYMELPTTEHKLPQSTLQRLVNQVNERFKDTKIDLLYIAHDENMSDGRGECRQVSDNLFIGKCFNRKRESDKDYNGNPQNAKLVLEGVQCEKKWFDWLLYKTIKLLKKIGKIFYVKKLKHGEVYMRILGIKVKCK